MKNQKETDEKLETLMRIEGMENLRRTGLIKHKNDREDRSPYVTRLCEWMVEVEWKD